VKKLIPYSLGKRGARLQEKKINTILEFCAWGEVRKKGGGRGNATEGGGINQEKRRPPPRVGTESPLRLGLSIQTGYAVGTGQVERNRFLSQLRGEERVLRNKSMGKGKKATGEEIMRARGIS